MAMSTLALVVALAALSMASSQQQPLYSEYSFNPLEHLAGIAPYFEPNDPARDPSPPQGCEVEKVAYLVRHAAINANDFDYETYLEPFTDKLKNTTVDWSKIPELSFLSTWTPPKLEEQELVTRSGKLEAAQLGVQMSFRYPKLRLPKRVWASTAERTVVSASGLIRGLETDDNEINLVQIYEGEESGANSLTPYKACPAYSSSRGSEQSQAYAKVYTAPIIARLKAYAPNFNWTSNDIIGMQEWCGYDTVVRGSSPFCSTTLFRPDEWLQFEYTQDLQYHYNVGYGLDVSGTLGYGWVNATQQILASDETDDQDIYVSFTHRELPPTVLVTLGLFNNSDSTGANDVNATMPLDKVNYHRQWVSSYILPFLTNIAIERMNCTGSYGYQNQTDPTYYRVLVNRSPQTLPDCHDGPQESCSAAGFKRFVEERGQMFGDFAGACGVEYDNSTDVMSFYSSPDNGTMVGKKH
ncbi:Putative histidine phosphatase superfamily, clade-2 [Septoria linicola]|uniref:Histidine phosphatase superfamily, clade-2 n=1 Tax=Septoria linicola TaxID=215465 RepID=A0A9Q9EIX0_9PEZI|nr:putative histidine phosphatase superfamily, clade-2 [Septoria linicola]USW52455.1 Putative histidine phosphatase superfamily, clade-2 [Septoria linicola]